MRTPQRLLALFAILAFAACSKPSVQQTVSGNALVYPGAKTVHDAAGETMGGTADESSSAQGEPSLQPRGPTYNSSSASNGQRLSTPDTFTAVKTWYTAHLPQGAEQTPAPGPSMATFRVGYSTITISSTSPDSGPTEIAIETQAH